MWTQTINRPSEFTAAAPLSSAAHAAGHKIAATYRRFQKTRAEWKRRARARRELATMDRREMAQAGISICDVENEIRRPFWKELSDMRRYDS